jgi:serine/threonine protein phosphatase PrpC
MPENKSKWTDEIVYAGLKEAVKKVDVEVTKIRKWDRQGSTVAAVYINRSEREGEGEGVGESNSDNESERDGESSLNGSKKEGYHSDDEVEIEDDNEEEEVRAIKRPIGMKSYSILTVNVGDSRVVLARSRRAIDLTSDHKPNLRYTVRTTFLLTSK